MRFMIFFSFFYILQTVLRTYYVIQQERIGSSRKREKEFHEKFGEPRIDSAITEYSNVSNFHDQNLK